MAFADEPPRSSRPSSDAGCLHRRVHSVRWQVRAEEDSDDRAPGHLCLADPRCRAEALRNLTERFRPALVAQPGFVAGYWAEAEDGRMVSITVWESEAAAERGGRRLATPLPGQDPAKIPSPDRVETLTVVTSA